MSETVPQMSLTDIQVVEQLIRVCCSRGAFRADELSSVGILYDKVSKIVAMTNPQGYGGSGPGQQVPQGPQGPQVPHGPQGPQVPHGPQGPGPGPLPQGIPR